MQKVWYIVKSIARSRILKVNKFWLPLRKKNNRGTRTNSMQKRFEFCFEKSERTSEKLQSRLDNILLKRLFFSWDTSRMQTTIRFQSSTGRRCSGWRNDSRIPCDYELVQRSVCIARIRGKNTMHYRLSNRHFLVARNLEHRDNVYAKRNGRRSAALLLRFHGAWSRL